MHKLFIQLHLVPERTKMQAIFFRSGLCHWGIKYFELFCSCRNSITILTFLCIKESVTTPSFPILNTFSKMLSRNHLLFHPTHFHICFQNFNPTLIWVGLKARWREKAECFLDLALVNFCILWDVQILGLGKKRLGIDVSWFCIAIVKQQWYLSSPF